MSKIKVLIVDDSLVFGKFLSENLPKVNPAIEIVGYARNPYDAEQKIPKLKPDVLSLDVEMPGMSGIDFLKKLLPKNPIPVVLVSSLNIGVFDALAFGAVDFVRKPDMSKENSTLAFAKNLATKLVIASCAKVRVPDFTRQVTPRDQEVADVVNHSKPLPGGIAPCSRNTGGVPGKTVCNCTNSKGKTGISAGSNKVGSSADVVARRANMAGIGSSGDAGRAGIKLPNVKPLTGYKYSTSSNANLKLNSTIIAIGASTGGTEATLEILKDLPADTPATVITQHMPKGFTKMYAERLNRQCPMEVREAKDGDELKRGLALVAPGDLQMRVVKRGSKYFISCKYEDKCSGHRPSVDVLFNSIAENVSGMKTVGIILTGMGQDGAKGLLNMRKRGAYTIGQDKDSCVVYGMPMVAQNIGAVMKQAPVGNICGLVVQHLNAL